MQNSEIIRTIATRIFDEKNFMWDTECQPIMRFGDQRRFDPFASVEDFMAAWDVFIHRVYHNDFKRPIGFEYIVAHMFGVLIGVSRRYYGCNIMASVARGEDVAYTEEDAKHETDPQMLTCNDCPCVETCDLAFDPYNTDGECLADK